MSHYPQKDQTTSRLRVPRGSWEKSSSSNIDGCRTPGAAEGEDSNINKEVIYMKKYVRISLILLIVVISSPKLTAFA
jgi:hypothetical protein